MMWSVWDKVREGAMIFVQILKLTCIALQGGDVPSESVEFVGIVLWWLGKADQTSAAILAYISTGDRLSSGEVWKWLFF